MIRLVVYDEGRHGTLWTRLTCRVVRRRKNECRSAYKRRRAALASSLEHEAKREGYRHARTHTLVRFDRKAPFVRVASCGELGWTP